MIPFRGVPPGTRACSPAGASSGQDQRRKAERERRRVRAWPGRRTSGPRRSDQPVLQNSIESDFGSLARPVCDNQDCCDGRQEASPSLAGPPRPPSGPTAARAQKSEPSDRPNGTQQSKLPIRPGKPRKSREHRLHAHRVAALRGRLASGARNRTSNDGPRVAGVLHGSRKWSRYETYIRRSMHPGAPGRGVGRCAGWWPSHRVKARRLA